MIEGVIIKQLGKFSDDRGWLSEFYRHDEADILPAMAYVSETKPGVVRGPHEHVYQTDYFVFMGPGSFEVHLWDRREGSATKDQHEKLIVGQDNPCSIIVPPGVVHGYKCVSEVNAWSINLPDRLYKGVGKRDEVIDEIRWETQEDSPYVIE
jgi:dTDP-4-dehydrorhamnose 3,5-epimerase